MAMPIPPPMQRLATPRDTPRRLIAWINVTRSVDNKKIMIRTSPPVNHRVSDQEILVELEKILDGVSGVRRLKREWLKVS